MKDAPEVGFDEAMTPEQYEDFKSLTGSVAKTPEVAPKKVIRQRAPRKEPEDKLPPHSIEMEQGVLGCILQEPDKCIGPVVENLKSGVEVFYDARHQHIYAEIIAMSDAKVPVEIITLQQRLKEKQMLEQIGGIPYLSSLQDSVPSAANLSYYLDVVADMATRRRIIQSCIDVVQKAFGQTHVNELVSDVEKVLTIQNERKLVTVLDGKAAGLAMVNDLERRMALDGKLSGLDSGIYDLNSKTEGLQLGEQFVVGARPSQGKTALGLAIFKHCAFSGVPSLFISLEMSIESLMRRMLAMHTDVSLRVIRRGSYAASDFGKFASFQALCNKHPMHFMDGVGGLGIRELCSSTRRLCVQHGIKLVVVDYLQKIQPSSKHEKRTYEVGDISGRLKALAVECKVAMVTLAQLNRENTKDKGRQPRLSDLADSGQIERDADVVGLLHKKSDGVDLLIAKQRDGETGMIQLAFDGPHVRFQNMSKFED